MRKDNKENSNEIFRIKTEIRNIVFERKTEFEIINDLEKGIFFKVLGYVLISFGVLLLPLHDYNVLLATYLVSIIGWYKLGGFKFGTIIGNIKSIKMIEKELLNLKEKKDYLIKELSLIKNETDLNNNLLMEENTVNEFENSDFSIHQNSIYELRMLRYELLNFYLDKEKQDEYDAKNINKIKRK